MPIDLPSLARHLIEELEWFGQQCRGQKSTTKEPGDDWTVAQHKSVLAVQYEREGLAAEPFIGYARVRKGSEELTYLVRRGYIPDWPAKRDPDTAYTNYVSNLGRLVEQDPGSTISIETVRLELHVQTFTILATNKFSIARTGASYDAVNNRILIEKLAPASIASLAEYLQAQSAGASTKQLVSEQRRRNVIDHVALRDQPILDAIQGEVFRQPMASQIILSGPAGTGKTTTLIKRIARNQRLDFLSNEEQSRFTSRTHLFGSNNWALFVPSDLLKGYVQEAFNKQGVAASSDRVLVWSSERNRIARDILRFAKIGSRGTFELNPTGPRVANADCIKLFEEFDRYWPPHMAASIKARLDEAPINLANRYQSEIATINDHLTAGRALDAITEIRRLRSDLQDGRTQAQEARERSRRPGQQRPLSASDEFLLGDDVRKAIERLGVVTRDVLSTLQPAFKAFVGKTSLAPHETDTLIRAMLEAGRNLRRIDANIDDPILQRIQESFVPQILIDEVADFSSNQIAALAALASPETDSVTLCGDIMQRVTTHGIATWQECLDIVPRARHFHIDVSYRQSPQLLAIASKILMDLNNKAKPLKSAYEGGDFPHALLKVNPDAASVYKWITDRIIDIYEAHDGKLPAIAVLVPSEGDVDRVADGLRRHLAPQSLEVQACKNAEVLGNESRVRVFNVEHIKGLEFEAVFFVDFDAIEKLYGSLTMNYLYVGLTRAATFLGVTCNSEPRILGGVADLFSRDDDGWAPAPE